MNSKHAFIIAVVLLSAGVFGCSSTKWATVRETPKNPLLTSLSWLPDAGLQPTARTKQHLRVHDLEDAYKSNPRDSIERLQHICEENPSGESVHALAEICYLSGHKKEKSDPREAACLYGMSAMYAYEYLFSDQCRDIRNPYDPQFRGACELYNGALEAALRVGCKHGVIRPGETTVVETPMGDWEIECQLKTDKWRAEDCKGFKFVSDYRMAGLKNHYRTYGLGVPLIALRREVVDPDPNHYYLPPNVSYPLTAFLRPVETPQLRRVDPTVKVGTAGKKKFRTVLELYDPLSVDRIVVNDRQVPLESDYTTPLAHSLAQPGTDMLANIGLLTPDLLMQTLPSSDKKIMGLYMFEPYQRGKIPVLMVHGLWSSPMTWVQMYNDLQADPEIRENYQFWFYLYPTGQPFLVSAAQLRRDLRDVRHRIDPQLDDSAMEQMVLVGHSMGGLVSRLQTIESQDDFWKLVTDRPFSELKAEPEVRQAMYEDFFFAPDPTVRRVVTIGTPHRGSPIANDLTRWFIGRLVKTPQLLLQNEARVFRDNKGFFRDKHLLTTETSIDALDPDSPVFPAMIAAERSSIVKYHNIIGDRKEESDYLPDWFKKSDGIVELASAKMDDVESEIIVNADHVNVHAHPRAVMEVRRVLLEHLEEIRRYPNIRPPKHVLAKQQFEFQQPHPPAQSRVMPAGVYRPFPGRQTY